MAHITIFLALVLVLLAYYSNLVQSSACSKCQESNAVACRSKQAFTYCNNGIPSSDLAFCPLGTVCTDNPMICEPVTTAEPSCSSQTVEPLQQLNQCGICNSADRVFSCLDEITVAFCFGNRVPDILLTLECPVGTVCDLNNFDYCSDVLQAEPSCKKGLQSPDTADTQNSTTIDSLKNRSTTAGFEINTESTREPFDINSNNSTLATDLSSYSITESGTSNTSKFTTVSDDKSKTTVYSPAMRSPTQLPNSTQTTEAQGISKPNSAEVTNLKYYTEPFQRTTHTNSKLTTKFIFGRTTTIGTTTERISSSLSNENLTTTRATEKKASPYETTRNPITITKSTTLAKITKPTTKKLTTQEITKMRVTDKLTTEIPKKYSTNRPTSHEIPAIPKTSETPTTTVMSITHSKRPSTLEMSTTTEKSTSDEHIISTKKSATQETTKSPTTFTIPATLANITKPFTEKPMRVTDKLTTEIHKRYSTNRPKTHEIPAVPKTSETPTKTLKYITTSKRPSTIEMSTTTEKSTSDEHIISTKKSATQETTKSPTTFTIPATLANITKPFTEKPMRVTDKLTTEIYKRYSTNRPKTHEIPAVPKTSETPTKTLKYITTSKRPSTIEMSTTTEKSTSDEHIISTKKSATQETTKSPTTFTIPATLANITKPFTEKPMRVTDKLTTEIPKRYSTNRSTTHEIPAIPKSSETPTTTVMSITHSKRPSTLEMPTTTEKSTSDEHIISTKKSATQETTKSPTTFTIPATLANITKPFTEKPMRVTDKLTTEIPKRYSTNRHTTHEISAIPKTSATPTTTVKSITTSKRPSTIEMPTTEKSTSDEHIISTNKPATQDLTKSPITFTKPTTLANITKHLTDKPMRVTDKLTTEIPKRYSTNRPTTHETPAIPKTSETPTTTVKSITTSKRPSTIEMPTTTEKSTSDEHIISTKKPATQEITKSPTTFTIPATLANITKPLTEKPMRVTDKITTEIPKRYSTNRPTTYEISAIPKTSETPTTKVKSITISKRPSTIEMPTTEKSRTVEHIISTKKPTTQEITKSRTTFTKPTTLATITKHITEKPMRVTDELTTEIPKIYITNRPTTHEISAIPTTSETPTTTVKSITTSKRPSTIEMPTTEKSRTVEHIISTKKPTTQEITKSRTTFTKPTTLATITKHITEKPMRVTDELTTEIPKIYITNRPTLHEISAIPKTSETPTTTVKSITTSKRPSNSNKHTSKTKISTRSSRKSTTQTLKTTASITTENPCSASAQSRSAGDFCSKIKKSGAFAVVTDPTCTEFYYCYTMNSINFDGTIYSCTGGLFFDATTRSCVSQKPTGCYKCSSVSN